jgi:RNA-directed DNA polymerase
MEKTKAPDESLSEEWAALPWRKLEQHLYRLQKRIFKASERGDLKTVHKLQKLLMKSRSARLLAVRRVTQDNQGKKTAGIDGVKAVQPTGRFAMVEALHPKRIAERKPQPLRRVWIPKPGKTEQRPLGIPVMFDRACQALAKQALEPQWEAKFEANSYGFRPGRGAHDAIGAIFNNIRLKSKYVLDADIKGCFDNIDHQALLEKLHTYPAMRRLVKGWLKAGVMEALELSPTETGTPQGGVVSPLLANIALYGMEEALQKAYMGENKAPTALRGAPQLIRYADDFVVLHAQETEVIKAQHIIATWLKGIGLELKPSKTRLSHTLKEYQGNVGFTFLGFTIRQFPVGKTHTGKGKPSGFKTIITPRKESIQRHLQELRKILQQSQSLPQEELIDQLNPVIHGWALGRVSKAICDMRSPPGKYALAEDDPKTPEEKRKMGKRQILANSGGEQVDIRDVRWLNAAHTSMARSNTHSTTYQGKRQSEPVRRKSPLLGKTAKRPSINKDDPWKTAPETARKMPLVRTSLPG